jgi:hypothetical protein
MFLMESYNVEKIDRFFLPVNKEVYEWYYIGKLWEIRNAKGRFNIKNIYPNRLIEIRKGYNGESLWGKIVTVLLFKDSNDLLEKINYKEIFPQCTSATIADKLIQDYIISGHEIIATQIMIIKSTVGNTQYSVRQEVDVSTVKHSRSE